MNRHSLCARAEYPATNARAGRRRSAAGRASAGRESAVGRRRRRVVGFRRSLGMEEVKYVCQGEVPHWLDEPWRALKWNAESSGQRRPRVGVRRGVVKGGGGVLVGG